MTTYLAQRSVFEHVCLKIGSLRAGSLVRLRDFFLAAESPAGAGEAVAHIVKGHYT